jgi:hypothetical protein
MEQMNITSAQYMVDSKTGTTSSIKAIIDNQELYVPLSPANRHYAEIVRQVEAGTLTIAPANEE